MIKQLSSWLNIFVLGLKNGFKQSLHCSPKQKNQQWIWSTMHDEDVCADCLERSTWPPMDIADWIKAGLPKTKEADTTCGHNCRCQLVVYSNQESFKK